ncbi:ribosome-binding GTPase RsgA [Candidatus Mancarchaeum acidiphilum]|uniref:Ribosome-binding GTPase RsgA n=1 Tax=Candidatus Mancarchaeum acidiphilum TaxID=1920749 RepID=A0A218NMV4_9ARCH|nr:ribosome small subunit-dependent GTPase A [Candidatus Mancarchaeum acidiphilum]ASI13820.1 ribosome-binding GTPase RsgA [Candidatus Mancarchaeum acidiphilum]
MMDEYDYAESRKSKGKGSNRSRSDHHEKRQGDLNEINVYSPGDAQKLGKIGIVAEMSPTNYRILYNNKFIEGIAEDDSQKGIVSQLVVGDNVIFELNESNPIIKGRTERHSKLARLRTDSSKKSQAGAEEHVIVANIDVAVIVASAIQPAFNPNMVDRYLVISQYGNVAPILCITKTDLAKPPDLSMYKSADLPIVKVSNKTMDGISDLLPYLKGKRCVMIGSSGVGKSSLINSILHKEVLFTDEVSEKSGKGRHTTSSSSLHLLDESTMLIDTPGIRSLGLWELDPESLRLYYPEFAEFAPNCKFSDCTHSHEPGCAVKKAVEEGFISRERYDSYIRLLAKLEYDR